MQLLALHTLSATKSVQADFLCGLELRQQNSVTTSFQARISLTLSSSGESATALGIASCFPYPNGPASAAKLNLANTLDPGTRYAEAEKLYLETLEAQRRVLGAEHPETPTTMHSLGNTLRREGHTDDAEKLQRETLAVRRRVIGPDHPETLRTMGALAATLLLQHRDTEAHQLYATRLEAIGRTQGKDSLAEAWHDYACGYRGATRRGHRSSSSGCQPWLLGL